MPMGITGVGFWWVFPLGGMVMMGVMAAIVLTRILPRGDHKSSPPPESDPLAVARERYARGEISHQEFEQLAEHLVRTEGRMPPRGRD